MAGNSSPIRSLVLSYFLLVTLMTFIALLISSVHKANIAASYFKTSKNSLVLGDFRSAMLQLNLALSDDFELVQYFGQDGVRIFSLPHRIDNVQFFERSNEFLVSLNKGGPTVGKLVFVYDLMKTFRSQFSGRFGKSFEPLY